MTSNTPMDKGVSSQYLSLCYYCYMIYLLIMAILVIVAIQMKKNNRAAQVPNNNLTNKSRTHSLVPTIAGFNLGTAVLFLGLLQDEIFNPESGTGDGSAYFSLAFLMVLMLSFILCGTPFYIKYLKSSDGNQMGRELAVFFAIVINAIVIGAFILCNTVIEVNIY